MNGRKKKGMERRENIQIMFAMTFKNITCLIRIDFLRTKPKMARIIHDYVLELSLCVLFDLKKKNTREARDNITKREARGGVI